MDSALNFNQLESSDEGSTTETRGGFEPVLFSDIGDNEPREVNRPVEHKIDLKKPKQKEETSNGEEESQEDGGQEEKSLLKSKVEKKPDKTKLYKLKSGDQEVTLRADTPIEVKVDGKLETVTFDELKNGYSGQSSLSRNYSTFKKERQEFESQRSAVQNLLNHSLECLEKGDVMGFYSIVGESLGKDPLELYRDAQKQILSKFEGRLNVSEEELKQNDVLLENQYYKTRTEREKQRQSQLAAQKQKQEQASQFREKYNLSVEEVEGLVDELSKLDLPPEQINFETLGYYYQDKKAGEKIESAFERVGLELDGDERNQAIRDLKGLIQNYPVAEKDLDQILTEIYGTKPKKNEVKDLARKMKKSGMSSDEKPARKSNSKEPMFFSDFE